MRQEDRLVIGAALHALCVEAAAQHAHSMSALTHATYCQDPVRNDKIRFDVALKIEEQQRAWRNLCDRLDCWMAKP